MAPGLELDHRPATAAGIPPEVGFGLRRAFLRAVLPEPRLRLESYLGDGTQTVASTWMAESVRSMLPLVLRFDIASETEVDIDTLADRLQAEATTQDGVVIKAPDLVSAWTHI
jgi:hypothetical protein